MKKLDAVKIGVIGGSGLYEFKGLKVLKELSVKTPFGNPSDKITVGELEGELVAFLPRHGQGHRVLPTEINSRANIFALKSLGVEKIIGVGACGSLKEELAPREVVIPDQLVDKTKLRVNTFFGSGIVVHIQFDKPFCPALSQELEESAKDKGIPVHSGGVYVCMEGPAFSTKAESLEHRRLGYSLVGMTASPEAKLAREAEICYATLAFVTDYDCWKESEDAVTASKVIENLKAGLAQVKQVLAAGIPKVAESSQNKKCGCQSALRDAIVNDPKFMNKLTLQKLKLLMGKYIKG